MVVKAKYFLPKLEQSYKSCIILKFMGGAAIKPMTGLGFTGRLKLDQKKKHTSIISSNDSVLLTKLHSSRFPKIGTYKRQKRVFLTKIPLQQLNPMPYAVIKIWPQKPAQNAKS